MSILQFIWWKIKYFIMVSDDISKQTHEKEGMYLGHGNEGDYPDDDFAVFVGNRHSRPDDDYFVVDYGIMEVEPEDDYYDMDD